MAEELEPVRQNIEINVTDKGTDEATKDLAKLDTTITSTTESSKKLTDSSKKQEEGFKTLKVQLKEAIVLQQKMSAQYGATSEEAIKASKAVASIKDEIGFQKDLVDSYNPDEKFRGLTQTAGLAALALGGVKDGLNAIGIESKLLDTLIGSAQAILGVTSAVAGITDAYEVLTAAKKAKTAAEVVEIGTTEALAVAEGEATVATWSFNAALLANPAVAIAAAIVALGAGIYAYTKLVSDTAKAEELAKVSSMQLTFAIEQQAKAFDNNSKYAEASNNQKIALLKASGASEAQIYKETAALKAQDNARAQINLREAQRLKEAAYQLDKANSTEATQEALKKATENEQKAFDILKKGFDDQDRIRDEHQVAVVQAETDARNKAEEERKKAEEKAREDAKKKREQDIKDKQELLKSEAQADIDTKKELQAVQDEINKEREDSEKEDRERVAAAKVAELEKFADDQKAIEEGMLQQKKDIQSAEIGIAERGIALITSIFGKSKAVQKGAIIAENAIGIGKQVIANNTANAGALATPQAIATSGASAVPVIALNNISTGIGIASTIAATAKALSAVGGGGAGSAGGSGGGAQPTRNVAQVGFQGSSENQISSAIAKQQKEQPPIQAFVVSQSVTDQQELDRKKELNNSF